MTTDVIAHVATDVEVLVGGRFRTPAVPADVAGLVTSDGVDVATGRPVLLCSRRFADDRLAQVAMRDAREAIRLDHPSIARVIDVVYFDDRLWIVSARPDGASLRDAALDPVTRTRVVASVATAVRYAHAHGVPHGTIDMDSIVVGANGKAKLAGFGLRAMRSSAETVAEGIPRDRADRASDLEAVASIEAAAGLGVSSRRIGRARSLRTRARSLRTRARSLRSRARSLRTRARTARHQTAPRMAAIALALATLAVVVAAQVGSSRGQPPPPPPAPPPMELVPGLAGMHVEDALEVLAGARLVPGERREVHDPAVPAGVLLGVDPAAGTRVRRGTAVGLIVSIGPEMVDVPDVLGQGADWARAEIVRAGLTVGRVHDAFHATAATGVVVEQVPSNAQAERGAAVDLVVSKGPELVSVPETDGMPLAEARATLQEAGFPTIVWEEWATDVPVGRVLQTKPAGGTQAAPGSRVTVVASKGPKPFAMPSVSGETIEDARAALEGLGLVVAAEHVVPGSSEPGVVLGQAPSAGTEVVRGTKVELHYGG